MGFRVWKCEKKKNEWNSQIGKRVLQIDCEYVIITKGDNFDR